ncbi:hypothetical protein RI129_002911 [Pyrocoelia pectoralis]|uniref:DDE Tnp4 domain-containing protein n=1 Tax=Pyrocoelia pectoralis TaxID=417401 RepID=A0AAN7VQL8_9COLE
MILQGVVDCHYQFLNICIKNPGSCHDAAVLTTSDLYRNIETLMPKDTCHINGENLPYLILGDPAYPLLSWLLKGFPNRGLTPTEDSFNCYVNSGRVVVEIAFGRLKSRWRCCLLKRLDVHTFVPYVMAACCTLHNITERFKDHFNPAWSDYINEQEKTYPQPNTINSTSLAEYEGATIRSFLKNYLANKYPLRQSHHAI